MFVYRIADARHPIFDPTGAMLHGGRWNSAGVSVIYAAETYSGAILELLVHANLRCLPVNHRVIEIAIPDEVSIETVSASQVLDWDLPDMYASRSFGDQWARSLRTAVLRVPSVVTKRHESNFVINTMHTDFSLISAGEPEPVYLDERLFHK
jgi:RES domain-containing protein